MMQYGELTPYTEEPFERMKYSGPFGKNSCVLIEEAEMLQVNPPRRCVKFSIFVAVLVLLGGALGLAWYLIQRPMNSTIQENIRTLSLINTTYVLYAGDPYNLQFIITILNSINTSYVLHNVSSTGLTGLDIGNITKLILSQDRLVHNVNGSWISALNETEWAIIYNLNVPIVSLYSTPSIYNYMEFISGDGTSKKLRYSMDMSYVGLNPSSELDLEYTWSYKGNSTNISTVYVEYSDGYPAISENFRYGTDRRMLHFFFDSSIWQPTPIALSRIWLNYLNILPQNETVYLSCQIDDLFLFTNIYNSTSIYRATPVDLQHTVNFSVSLESLGVKFKAEMAYNGNGVYIHGGPLMDELFKFSYYNREKFYWVSHTYTHLNLDNVTYEQAYQEQSNNINLLESILFSDYENEHNSHHCMVTPQISGLFNGNALQALHDNGVEFLVGDNTRPELQPDTFYGYINTTTNIHGFPGMIIIPRWATVIYYDCSTVEENAREYNHIYESYWGRKLTFEEIISLESQRVVRLLLLRHWDAYMFHQANLRMFEYMNRSVSLLQLWVEAVVNEYRRYSTLPIKSVSQQTLANMFLNRF